MRKKFVAFMLMLLIIGGVFCNSHLGTAPYIKGIDRIFLFDENISLSSNCTIARIIIDDDIETKRMAEHGSIIINMGMLEEGWHKVDIYANHLMKLGVDDSHIEFMVHVIDDQPNVYMPIRIVVDAREGNSLENKPYQVTHNYKPESVYYNYKPHDLSIESLSLDNHGIMMYFINEVGWIYHPVVIIQEALGQYNKYIESNDELHLAEFLHLCDWLTENMDKNGAYIYPYSVQMKPTYTLPLNFISGMAQGQALSAFTRAYIETNDMKYLEAGRKCLEFMLTDGSDEVSGTKRNLSDFTKGFESAQDYKNYIIFEEYLTNPCWYVLNGDLFALMGLYDWYTTAPAEYGGDEAKEAFDNATKSISFLLPYYDMYGWSCYDLYWHTSDGLEEPGLHNSYAHQCHIYLLDFLRQVVDDERVEEYYQRFKMYSDEDFWRQSEVIYKKE